MSDGKTAKVVIGRWKVMATNLQPQLDKLPQLAGKYAELVKMTSDAEALETRKAQLTADSQDVNHQHRDILKAGEDLRNRIGAILKAEVGFTSERLLEFGLKPKRLRGRGKKSAAKTPAKTSEQPAAATSSAQAEPSLAK
ncbi:MAG TPA: hypothetical protein VF173_28215 [Thermoanaerobaculia bacterium]|nr:hypothetical protein [Thermoanaerobaculia bacterium]